MSDRKGDHRREQADTQGDASAVENAGEDVAAEVVAAEEVVEGNAFARDGFGEGVSVVETRCC